MRSKARSTQLVILLRREHPFWTQAQIGRAVHFSQGYISQILSSTAEFNKRVVMKRFVACVICGKLNLKLKMCVTCRSSKLWVIVNCSYCNALKKLRKPTYEYLRRHNQKKFYCREECYHKGRTNALSGW